jgi:formate/nitrite transporter FocA (FNT family)
MRTQGTDKRNTMSLDAFTSAEIARRIEAVSIQRATLPTRSLVCLGLLGGLYIGFGGALATLALTDNSLGFGLGRLTAGLAFSLGLIVLVIAGGELFTGNNLMVVAYAGGQGVPACASAQLVPRVHGQCRGQRAARACRPL